MSILQKFYARKFVNFEYEGVKFRLEELTGDELLALARDPRNVTDIAANILRIQLSTRVLDNGEYRKMSLDGEVVNLPQRILDVFTDRMRELGAASRDAQAITALANVLPFLPNDTPEEVVKWFGKHLEVLQSKLEKTESVGSENPLPNPNKPDDTET
jgi:hypothetical protein